MNSLKQVADITGREVAVPFISSRSICFYDTMEEYAIKSEAI